MAGNIKYDPDFWKAFEPFAAIPRPVADDALTQRANSNATLELVFAMIPETPGVEETEFKYQTKDGKTLTMYRFTKSATTTDAKKAEKPPSGPAVLFVHGGGFISGSVPVFRNAITYYVAKTGIPFFAPGYRVAPENPFPGPVDDVYAGLEWLRDHAKEQDVDPARIALFGPSAGGGLAAGVTLLARDKGFTPPIAKLLLLYPMLDDRTFVPPDNLLSKFVTWTQKNNEIGWGAYLGPDRSNVSPYAAPARATDVSGFPVTYIDCGSLDLFRDETLAFAAKLAAANIDVELHLYPGVPHGFEAPFWDTPVSQKAQEIRVWALRDL
ncbi:Alpha/Beta hydrolase protein [Lasiosphaeria ovina]|uniref:Alpha/Beta hydrolase protein n=1 Tax=Lasiosphaeria ovina TaxID=92902 RepID=A0AAE0JUY6_9PEZI|nr:Alpha/Beta hydrolase protein [Lasiosphaeria ovina]